MSTSANAQQFDLVIFGGTGDLAMRKLVPAVYNIYKNGGMPEGSRLIAVARTALDLDAFHALLASDAQPHVHPDLFDEDTWATFLQHVEFVRLDLTDADSYRALGARLDAKPDNTRLYYLSTGPGLFGPICQHLHGNGLILPSSRVAVEKPLGHDRASANEINDLIADAFEESQIFRIDHYLGKEPVQNLIALRFGNSLFEPLWRRGRIRDVQITVAEELGIGRRGDFYDRTGALRDMVQNHLLQLLCIIAMEPPLSVEGDSIRDEKLKVLRSLRPMTAERVLRNTVRGQYVGAQLGDQALPGYLEENGVAADSQTETFVALKTTIDNWRWSGVPFYLRTGKRMQTKVSEIVITFDALPHSIFSDQVSANSVNRLVIQLQPVESIRLHILSKKPGDALQLKPVMLDLDLSQTYNANYINAYQRLLVDLIAGKQALFMRRDEQDAAWAWIDPIIDTWQSHGITPKPYRIGSWGPAASGGLLGRRGLSWHEESL
ncbi:MAG: glucose-6-phosphate dehydrogenase [Pseudomonadota bacterium]